MQAPDLYTHFLRRLNATGIRYMITGGLAAIIYGEPRLTNDVDLVIALGPDEVDRLVSAFPAPAYYVPPAEVVRDEAARPRWGHFNLLHVDTALRADVYALGDDELGAWAMARRWAAPMAGETVAVAPIEYVILKTRRALERRPGHPSLNYWSQLVTITRHAAPYFPRRDASLHLRKALLVNEHLGRGLNVACR